VGNVRWTNLKGQLSPIRRPVDIGDVIYREQQTNAG
jgi:hypothetical protein